MTDKIVTQAINIHGIGMRADTARAVLDAEIFVRVFWLLALIPISDLRRAGRLARRIPTKRWMGTGCATWSNGASTN